MILTIPELLQYLLRNVESFLALRERDERLFISFLYFHAPHEQLC